MALHFSVEEFAYRQRRLKDALSAEELDGILLFSQESMYYLTGYDGIGYVFFQCLYFGADGRLILLARSPDLLQAQQTSTIKDIRVWVDSPGANPAQDLRRILEETSCGGKRIGGELDSYGLTAANWCRVQDVLGSFCSLVDASGLVPRLRVLKSQAEIEYVRRAAELADDAIAQAVQTAGEGVSEGDVLTALQGSLLAGGGDHAAIEPIIGSGPGALLCRPYSGRRNLSSQDQLTLEFCGVYRRYHAAMMRTIVIGQPTDRHRAMHTVAVEALGACKAALMPGRPIGDVFDAYASTCDSAGMRAFRLNATGYSLGATFAPNWMDWPMFYAGNEILAEPSMVFFVHVIMADGASGTGMSTGQTVVVTDSGCESLSNFTLDLIAR